MPAPTEDLIQSLKQKSLRLLDGPEKSALLQRIQILEERRASQQTYPEKVDEREQYGEDWQDKFKNSPRWGNETPKDLAKEHYDKERKPFDVAQQNELNKVSAWTGAQKVANKTQPPMAGTPAPTAAPELRQDNLPQPIFGLRKNPTLDEAIPKVEATPLNIPAWTSPATATPTIAEDTNKMLEMMKGMKGTVKPQTQDSHTAAAQSPGMHSINRGMSGVLQARDPRYQDPNKDNPLSERAEDAPRDYAEEAAAITKQIQDLREHITAPGLVANRDKTIHDLNVKKAQILSEAKAQTNRDRRSTEITALNEKHAKEDADNAKEGEFILKKWKESQQKKNPKGIPYTPEEVNKVIDLINSGGRSPEVETLINNIRNPPPRTTAFVAPKAPAPTNPAAPAKPEHHYPDTLVGRKVGTEEPLSPKETAERETTKKLLNYLSDGKIVNDKYVQYAMNHLNDPKVRNNVAIAAQRLTPVNGVKITDKNQWWEPNKGKQKYQEPPPPPPSTLFSNNWGTTPGSFGD